MKVSPFIGKKALGIVVLVLLWWLYMGSYLLVQPIFETGSYKTEHSTKWKKYTYYDFLRDENQTIDFRLPMVLRYHIPKKLKFRADDCLKKVTINNVGIPFQEKCGHDYWHVLAIPDGTLRKGMNYVEIQLQNWGGKAYPSIALPLSPFMIALHEIWIIIIAISVYTLFPSFIRRVRQAPRPLLIIIGLAVLLRLWYFQQSTIYTWSHDASGHMHYIRYVLKHLSIPALDAGWQTYQPPLYYMTNALFLLPSQLISTNMGVQFGLTRLFSLLLSVGALLAAVWGSYIFFGKKADWRHYVFVATTAVLPGIFLNTVRISNDAFMIPLWFVWFCLLYKFWLNPQAKLYFAASVMLGLCLLTKANALAIIPVHFITLLAHPKLATGQKSRVLLWAVLILSIVSGWLFILRYVVQGQVHIVGNIERNTADLFAEDWTPLNFISFRFGEMLRYPYNKVGEELVGWGYFWEYMPKSVFTGEWNFGGISHVFLRIIYCINFILIPLAAGEMYRDIKRLRSSQLPVWLTLLSLIGASMALVANKNNGGLTDFRYITLLAFPVTYYVIKAIEANRYQKILLSLLWAMLGCCIVVLFIIGSRA